VRVLNLRRLRRLRLTTVAAILSVAAGCSLALSVVLVYSSISYSLSVFGQTVGGPATLRVVGATDAGALNDAVLRRVNSTPGVIDAIPVIQAITVVRTSRDELQSVLVLGVDCNASLVFEVSCSSQPHASGIPDDSYSPIAISGTLKRQLGGTSWIQTDTGTQSLVATRSLTSLDSINRGQVIVVPLTYAQEHFNRVGRFDDIYVVPSSSVSTNTLQRTLGRAVGPWNGVVESSSAPPAAVLAISAFLPILVILGLLSTTIAVILVYNAVALSLVQRRRERAIVAAIGAPPWLLVLGPLLEAGIIGALGGLVGSLVSLPLAHPIVNTVSRITLELVGIPISLHASPSIFFAGIAMGGLIGLLAAVRPVIKAMGVDLVGEISGRDQYVPTAIRQQVRLATLYSILAIVGVTLSELGGRNGSLNAWQPFTAILGFILTTVFAVLAVGAWAPMLIGAFATGVRHQSGITRLGIANLVRESGRTGVMAIAISATVALGFMTSSYSQAISQQNRMQLVQSSRSHSVLVTTAAGTDGFDIQAGIPTAVLTRLARIPGVVRLDASADVLTGLSADDLILVEASSGPPVHRDVFTGADSAGAIQMGGVLIGANLARRDHLTPGSRLRLDTPSGFRTVRVEGIWDDGDATGENVTMSLALEQHIFGPQLPYQVSLVLASGDSPSQIARLATQAHLGPYLRYLTPAQQLLNTNSTAQGQLAPFWVLQRALLVVAFVSVLTTLSLVGIQRKREFGLLGAVGITPAELFMMIASEALIVSITAAILGAVLGFVLLASLLDISPLLAGYHDAYSPDSASLLAYASLALTVAVAASIWPAWRSSRTPIVEALSYE
jgi:putative ABC transport system permease protein